LLATKRHELFALIAFESHDPSRAVAVWGTKSTLDQTMVSPGTTGTSLGENPKFCIVTV
jgi:hypothetical protein